jgi:predicted transcriptional regulator
MVLLEHPRRNNGWSLDEGLKADETAPDLYRFKLPVAAHSTEKLVVRERGPEHTRVNLTAGQDQTTYLLDLVKRVPDAQEKLEPVILAQVKLADMDRRIDESKKVEVTAAADEARDRDNLTALKGNDAARRFVDELNRAEDLLQATRKQTADLELQKKEAVEKLNELIAGVSFDWDVTAK